MQHILAYLVKKSIHRVHPTLLKTSLLSFVAMIACLAALTPVKAAQPADTVLKAGTLFIEAEDFNFGHGQWITNQPIGMTGTYAGGLYQDLGDGLGGALCDGSDLGIDFNDNGTSDQAIYRPGTPVEAGKPNGPAGLARGPFDVTVNHVIGWTGGGEWMNYTRRFPEPAKVYKVYARMAHGDAAQRRGGELSVVTSDPTKCNQTVQVVGSFDAPWTGGWDTWPDAGTDQDALVPMRDAAGAEALVKLGGLTTVRWTFRGGSGDLDYIAFVATASAGLPPKVLSLSPANNSTGTSDLPKVLATIQDGDVEKVVSASLKVDGAAVTATVTKTGAVTTVSYTVPKAFVAGSSHTVTLSYTDNATPPVTRTADSTFRVSFTPFRADTLFIEAEDFNFGKGQWVTNKAIGMTGPYDGGDYMGKGDGLDGTDCDGSDFGIDYFESAASNAQNIYRAPTGVEAGKPNGPAGVGRGTFDVKVNHTVGWNDAGDWYNYTRIFPTNSYKVYARMATGGQDRHAQLDLVTGDPTKCNQTLQLLGNFDGPTTGGWDTWPDAGTPADALVPLRDASGLDAVVKLGGKQTIRFTTLPGNLDIDYLALMPLGTAPIITQQIPAPSAPGLSISGALDNTPIKVAIEDNATKVVSASLKVDGVAVAATVTKTNSTTRVTFIPAQPFLPGSSHTVSLTYTDNAVPPVTRTLDWTFSVSVISSTSFAIEAEDFDYDGGKTNPQKGVAGMDVNVMPYLGGAYDTLSAIERIDFVNNDGPDSDVYRTELGDDGDHEVNINNNIGGAAGNSLGGTFGILGNDRVSWTMTANYKIGWVESGSWQNYTRTFPTNATGGWWKVFAALSYGGTGDGQLAGSLDQVTAGWGTTTQTVTRLGQFSAPGSGDWGRNNLVPMKTATGADAVVKLKGTNTLRFNLGSGDFDFFILTQAPAPPPFVATGPGGGVDSSKRDAVVLDWTINDTDSKVATNTIKVLLGGVDMTSKASITKTGATTSVHIDLSGTVQPSGEQPWRLTFQDLSSQSVTTDGTYLVNPYPTPGVFVIEAEDFNYSDTPTTNGGKTNPKKGVAGQDVNVMPYDGGAYDQLSAVEGVDYNNNDGEDSLAYRTEADATGGNEVDITASNGSRYSNDRGVFNLANNYRIGWVEDGSWQNYTRTFPTNSYNVWAALSFDGRSAGQLRGSLDMVTSDATKPNQTTSRLGTFNYNGSGGWGRNELVPMKGTNGLISTISLGGTQTVRFNLGSGDFDYLVFVPVTVTPAGPKFTSIKRNANGSLTIEWTGGGVLEAAGAVTGPWAPVTGATSPYTFTPAAAQKVLFGRIRL